MMDAISSYLHNWISYAGNTESMHLTTVMVHSHGIFVYGSGMQWNVYATESLRRIVDVYHSNKSLSDLTNAELHNINRRIPTYSLHSKPLMEALWNAVNVNILHKR